MKKIFFLILLSGLTFAQKNFQVDVDFARFNFDDSSGYLEIYYSFHQNELLPVKLGDRTFVKGIVEVSLKDMDSGKNIINKSWQINSNPSGIDSSDKNLTGVISMQLNFGRYICLLKSSDGYDTSRVDTTSFKVDIAPLPKDRFSLSDIEFASSITQVNKKADSFFIKNSYEVIPNPSMVFGEHLPVLYFYSEFYNLSESAPSKHLGVEYTLKNSFNREVFHKNKAIPVTNNSIVDVGTINVNKYPSGIYIFIVALTDSTKDIRISSSKKFYIVNPSVIDTVPLARSNDQSLSSEFGAMSDEELDRVFAYSKYISTSRESEEWKKLKTEEGKKQFLVNFWKARRSPADPSKIITWNEYLKRVETANQRFNAYQNQGWKTDRGRVLIVYGEPGEVERFPQQSDTKAYEIWHYYDIEGGVIFVFADLQGFGSYSLLHSTKRGELKNDNWQDQIKTY